MLVRIWSKTERQRLEEEIDDVLACLAVCEVACSSVDQALERITKERQNSSKHEKSGMPSFSELMGANRRQQNRQPQTDTLCSVDSRTEGYIPT